MMDKDLETLSAGWRLFTASARGNIPISMTLELTRRCHLHCAHCYLNETQEPNAPAKLTGMRERELNAAEWDGVFAQLADAGCMYLVLTGGEVFLRPDFLEIARSARERAFNVRVFTTAMHVGERAARELAAMGVDRVEVSLYGSRETHAKVTRCGAAYDRTLAGVRHLLDAGLRVTFKVPLMSVNFKERHALLDLAAEYGAQCKFDPTIVPRNDGARDNIHLRLTAAELDEVFADPRTTELESVERAEAFQSGEFEDFLCSAGRNEGGMDPYGNVYPCIQWALPCGNARERPFADIWSDSPVLAKVRRMKHERTCSTGQPSYCNNCPGLASLENGDPLKPSVFDAVMQDGFKRHYARQKEEAV